MGKIVKKRDVKRRSKDDILPLGKDNFRIIGIGVLVILGGYLAMLEGSVEGFLPLVVAPVLLVAGYCVIIPLGILYKKNPVKSELTGVNQEGQP